MDEQPNSQKSKWVNYQVNEEKNKWRSKRKSDSENKQIINERTKKGRSEGKTKYTNE